MNTTAADVMDSREVAARLKVSPRTVADWAKDGDLPSMKCGKFLRFRRSSIERWEVAREEINPEEAT
jgi:excisionase family DNA binding protein